jgi:type II secretory ATPase GspE/PulE/Tfp pilus assembly ATPase PilB-like protein
MNETAQLLQAAPDQDSLDIPELVNCLLRDAAHAGASDIHIEPWEAALVVRLRLNGVLSELVRLPLELMERLSGRLKVMANLVTYHSALPQEGHVPANPAAGGVELRLSVFPTVRGEKIVIRIFDPASRSFDLASLGFEETTLQSLYQLLARPNGLLLLTGPTGSGKTTAIYSALCYIVQRWGSALSVGTVEDPVEYSLPMISQAQINPAQEFTYPVALRSLLRQDPQVIMVGEIRDPETASMAIQAGLTGYLVISTIHSGSTAGVFARLVHMEIEPFLLASSIVGVLSLRLVRKNCPLCAEPYQPPPALLRLVPPEAMEIASFRHGTGCPQCHQTGFSGRNAVTEMLVVNEAFRDAVMQKLPARALQQVAIEQGMQTLWQNGLRQVLNGQTTLEEILRVITIDKA